MENRFKDNRDNDYSFFLNQLKFDVELGNLDSFLLGIGIENAGEFFEICEFALKGDKEAFFHVFSIFGNYYIEEELSDDECIHSFNRERILDLISKINYSESMQKNCVKMLESRSSVKIDVKIK